MIAYMDGDCMRMIGCWVGRYEDEMMWMAAETWTRWTSSSRVRKQARMYSAGGGYLRDAREKCIGEDGGRVWMAVEEKTVRVYGNGEMNSISLVTNSPSEKRNR
jgi:hypothetical protein